MIYLDTSVVLAHLAGEDRRPPASLWRETLTSSRLLEVETWNRLRAHGLVDSHGELARLLIAEVAMLELNQPVIARALEPFPGPYFPRTLDALHLASCAWLRDNGRALSLASYDRRMTATARAMDIPVFDLDAS